MRDREREKEEYEERERVRVIEIEKEREREKEIETKIYCRFASLPFSLSVLRVLQLQFYFVILYCDLYFISVDNSRFFFVCRGYPDISTYGSNYFVFLGKHEKSLHLLKNINMTY